MDFKEDIERYMMGMRTAHRLVDDAPLETSFSREAMRIETVYRAIFHGQALITGY